MTSKKQNAVVSPVDVHEFNCTHWAKKGGENSLDLLYLLCQPIPIPSKF